MRYTVLMQFSVLSPTAFCWRINKLTPPTYLDMVPLALECINGLTMGFSQATDSDPHAGV